MNILKIFINPNNIVRYIAYILTAIVLTVNILVNVYLDLSYQYLLFLNVVLLLLFIYSYYCLFSHFNNVERTISLKKIKTEKKSYRSFTLTILPSIISFIFSIYDIVLFVIYHNYWYLLLAIFFFLISVFRVTLYALSRKKYFNKTIFVLGSVFSLILIIVQILVIIIMYLEKGSLIYDYFFMITIAIYTVYKLIVSIVSSIEFEKKSKLYLPLTTIKNIDTFFSIYLLQTAFSYAFVKNNNNLLNLIVGILVSIISFSFLIYLIIKGNEYLKNQSSEL